MTVQPHCPACNAPLAEARVIATRLRLRIDRASASPALTEFALYSEATLA